MGAILESSDAKIDISFCKYLSRSTPNLHGDHRHDMLLILGNCGIIQRYHLLQHFGNKSTNLKNYER